MLKLSRKHGAALAFAAALLATPIAMAATQGVATVSNLSFSLIDLDPSDGVLPSIIWSDPYATVQADRSSGQIVTLLPQPDGSVQWGVSFAQTVSDAHQGTSSFLEALSASNPGVSAASGATQFTAQAIVDSPGVSLSSFVYGTGSFTLSANTELRVTGLLNTQVNGPGSAGFQGPVGAAANIGVVYSQASAYAEVFLGSSSTLSNSGGVSYTPNTSSASFPVDAYSDSSSPLLGASFRNESSIDASGAFYVLVQATASELQAVPVPEPGTGALLALGLCAVALRGARMRRNSAA